VLSELPQRWISATRAWHAHNQRHHPHGLDPDTEYLYYQSVVGAWPISVERLQRYMEKAVRESKVHTQWSQVNADYEERLRRFIADTRDDAEFIGAMQELVDKLLLPGRINSLAQTLIKLTAPGVPDIYQGCELWDLSLCDPDNRRPVDFALRQRLLDELDELSCVEVMQRLDAGLPKLWLIRAALRLRRELPACFDANAAYAPLHATGERREHVVAFLRGGQCLTVVPRLWASLPHATTGAQWGEWGDTQLNLPRGNWRNCLEPTQQCSGEVALATLLQEAPLALLVKES
jgi:(1->4)-alpha-D-glucan 1-alpha-D-glucosylmutase